MGIVQLPGVGARGDVERAALRRGLATGAPVRLVRVLREEFTEARAYCAGCAGPIEFGAVARGAQAYCSIECSLGGDSSA
jgi:hypothetical protein